MFLLGIVFLVLLQTLSLSTENQSTINTSLIPTSGEIPKRTYDERILSFVSVPGDSVWLFTDNKVYHLDKIKMKWTFFDTLNLDDYEIRGAYDAKKRQILFWSRGAGKVFEWTPGSRSMIRLDKSFHHRTQFDHFGFIHPTTGSIYAFGGTGFWQDKGSISRYDPSIREWSIIMVTNPENRPKGRRNALGLFDERKNQLHITGGYGNPEERHDLGNESVRYYDYWIFDFDQNSWTSMPLYGLSSISEENRSIPEYGYLNTNDIDDTNEIIWYLVPSKSIDHLQVLVYDIQRGFGVYLPVFVKSQGLLYLEYEKERNRLILYEAHLNHGDRSVSLEIREMPLLAPEKVRNLMDSIRTSEISRINTSIDNENLSIIAGLFFTVFVGFIWFRRIQRKNTVNKNPLAYQTKSNDINTIQTTIKIQIKDHNISISVSDVDIISHFTLPELELFTWMAWKNSIGAKYQQCTLLEELFFNHHSDPDYVRKLRNTSLKRLDEQLRRSLKGYFNKNEFIIHRNSFADKRKREYAINFEADEIVIEILPESIIALRGDSIRNSNWFKNIKNDINS